MGYACNAVGVCTGGSPTSLDFNLVAYTVSGTLTVDGAPPACPSAGAKVGSVLFSDGADQRTAALHATCTPSGPTTFTGLVYPGTYGIKVTGDGTILPLENQSVASMVKIAGATSGLAYDATTSSVSGTVTRNGVKPTCTATGSSTATAGTVTMVKKANNLLVQFDATCTAKGPTTFTSGPLGAGTYELQISGKPGSNLPSGTDTLAQSLVVQGSTGNLSYDIQTYPVSGTVTLSGAAPTCSAPASSAATVYFSDSAARNTGRLQATCTTGGKTTFSGQLPPGTYDVSVAGGSGSNLPGVDVAVATSVSVQGPVSGLSYDVKAFSVGGTLTLNGAAPSCTGSAGAAAGDVTFKDATQGVTVDLPATCNPGGATTFTGVVPPGTYDVSVRGSAPYTNLPIGDRTVATALAVSGNMTTLTYDLPAFAVSGTVTLNGASPQCMQPSYPAGSVTFADTTSTTSISLVANCTAGGPTTWSGFVYPGTYKVSIGGSFASNLPQQEFVAAPSLAVQANAANLTYDVKTYAVSGTVAVNGGSPVCGTTSTVINLYDAAQALSFPLSGTCMAGSPATFSGFVYAGTYSVTTYDELVVGALAVP